MGQDLYKNIIKDEKAEEEDKKELEFIFKNIHSCDEVMNPKIWNPDWYQCPLCLEKLSSEGTLYHKPKSQLTQ